MYHASELFIIKDVLDIYTQQQKINACYVLPATSEKQQMLVDQKAKKFTELLPCTFAVYDCRQLEDVSCVENFHFVTELLTQVFLSSTFCHLHLPSLRSVVPQAFGALELKGPLYMTSYLMFTCRSVSFQYFHAFHQQFLHGLSLGHQIIFVQQQ